MGAMTAGGASQYMYAPVIHPAEAMMAYQHPQYQTTDITEASMMEAAAPPTEVHLLKTQICTSFLLLTFVTLCSILTFNNSNVIISYMKNLTIFHKHIIL